MPILLFMLQLFRPRNRWGRTTRWGSRRRNRWNLPDRVSNQESLDDASRRGGAASNPSKVELHLAPTGNNEGQEPEEAEGTVVLEPCYLNFLADSPDPFFEVCDTGKLLLANRAATFLFSPHQVVFAGIDFREAFEIDESHPLVEAISNVSNSDSVTLGGIEFRAEVRPSPLGIGVLLREAKLERFRDAAWRDAEQLLRDSAQGMATIGPDGRMAKVTPEFVESVGQFLGDPVGRLWIESFEPDDLDLLHKAYLEMRFKGTAVTEVRSVAEHGAWRWLRLTFRSRDGVPGFTIYSIDLTAQKRNERDLERQVLYTQEARLLLEMRHQEMSDLNSRLKTLAETDGLTGVLNHRAFQDCLTNWIHLDLHFSIVMVDVDHFKSYNDAYGHPVGDELLREFAQLLQSNVRGEDIVARYGGEEFVMLLRDADGPRVEVFLERIRTRIAAYEWPNRTVSASFGYTTYDSGVSKEVALKQADAALYEAKASGRNCIRSYSRQVA